LETPEVDAEERILERLGRRLAAVARRAARSPATARLAALQSANAAAEQTQVGDGFGVHNRCLVLGRG
jgi:hypothetical protein